MDYQELLSESAQTIGVVTLHSGCGLSINRIKINNNFTYKEMYLVYLTPYVYKQMAQIIIVFKTYKQCHYRSI